MGSERLVVLLPKMTENADTHKGEDTHDEVGIEIMKGAHKRKTMSSFFIFHTSLCSLT